MKRKQLILKLNKLEKQIKTIQKMVEDEHYCIDILLQISILRTEIDVIAIALIETHTKRCLKNAIELREGDQEIDEMLNVINKFIK